MASTYDFVVVGAGICGSSAAYYLKKNGAGKVLLVERGPSPASSNTGKSAAIVRTFYTIPLMARLAKAAVDMFASFQGRVRHRRRFSADRLYPVVSPRSGWTSPPRRWPCTNRLASTLEPSIRRTSPASTSGSTPKGIGIVVYEENSGYADPVRTTEAFVNAFVAAGGEARFRTPCRGLIREGDRVTGVLLEDGPLTAGTVINAAGPWSRFLAEHAGIDLPIRAVREQDTVWEVPAGRPMPTTPVANAAEAVYMRPLGGERWLLGRGYPKPYVDVDPNNFKESLDNDAALDMHERWTKRVPPLQGAKLLEGYAALYDVTPDWMPLRRPAPGAGGVLRYGGRQRPSLQDRPGHRPRTRPMVTGRKGGRRLSAVQP